MTIGPMEQPAGVSFWPVGQRPAVESIVKELRNDNPSYVFELRVSK